MAETRHRPSLTPEASATAATETVEGDADLGENGGAAALAAERRGEEPDGGGATAEPVDLVMCAGNVMVFLAPGTERRVLERLCAITRPGGRVVIGSRPGTDYAFEAFDADLASLEEGGMASVQHRFATWHLDPFEPGGDFAVTVLERGEAPIDVA